MAQRLTTHRTRLQRVGSHIGTTPTAASTDEPLVTTSYGQMRASDPLRFCCQRAACHDQRCGRQRQRGSSGGLRRPGPVGREDRCSCCAAHTAGCALCADTGAAGGVRACAGMESYRGIPFAAPPVGPLRFKKPQKAAPWDGIRDATKYGAAAMQAAVAPDPEAQKGPDGKDTVFSQMAAAKSLVTKTPGIDESCLFLNVNVPEGATPADSLPVMCWIHGGAWRNGTAGSDRSYVHDAPRAAP